MRDTIIIIKSLMKGTGEYFNLKFLPSFALPIFGFMFGFGTEKIMLALLLLIVMDFITGVLAAKKSGEPIRSRNAVKSAYKVAVYGLLVSAGHLTESIVPGSTYIQEAVTAFLALTELISILENAGKMGFAVPQRLLNQLHKWREDDPEVATVIADRRTGDSTRREDEVVIQK